MIDTASWFGDCLVSRLSASKAPSREAVIVFRGFPGSVPPGQEGAYAHLANRPTIAATIAATIHGATARGTEREFDRSLV